MTARPLIDTIYCTDKKLVGEEWQQLLKTHLLSLDCLAPLNIKLFMMQRIFLSINLEEILI